MRYQELREARGHLENAILYLQKQGPRDCFGITVQLLLIAKRLINEEVKHPERFNLDGTKREVRFRRISPAIA
jgi:hypothetical protein